jgi:hypothetical protein
MIRSGKWDNTLRDALKQKYGAEKGGIMWRKLKGINNAGLKSEAALAKAAGVKLEEMKSEDYGSKDISSGIGEGKLNEHKKQLPGSGKKSGGFSAGEGARWHVHYDHFKWGTSANTRMNFRGRQKTDILNEFMQHQPALGDVNRPSWDACWTWMNTNLPAGKQP